MSNIGMITEQGDLGLGFNPLSQKDQEILKEQEKLVNRDNEDKDN